MMLSVSPWPGATEPKKENRGREVFVHPAGARQQKPVRVLWELAGQEQQAAPRAAVQGWTDPQPPGASGAQQALPGWREWQGSLGPPASCFLSLESEGRCQCLLTLTG